MKICHLVHNFFPAVGGIEIQTKNLSEGLSSLGHTNIVITKGASRRYTSNETLNGVQIVRRLYSPESKEFYLRMFGSLYNFIVLFKLRNKFQIIHLKASFLEFMIPCWLLKKILRKKTIYSLSISNEIGGLSNRKLPRLQLFLKKRIILSFDGIVTMTKTLTDELINFGIPVRKITYITNGVESDRFVPNPRKRIRGRVIYLGRIDPQKGIDVLLKAWRGVAESKHDCHLVIGGRLPEGQYTEQLIKYINDNKLEKSVVFKGEVDYYSKEIVSFFQSGEVFVLPSVREGMPGVLLQAMSCSLPIVSTKVSGARAVIKDRVNGRLVDINDVDGLSNAIIELLEMEDDKKARMGSINREKIVDDFDQEKRTALYLELFKKVLSSTPPKRTFS